MSSWKGEKLSLCIFGQSHGPAIGMTLTGVPSGYAVDMEALQAFLNRRAPGNAAYATTRKEADKPEFLAGLVDNCTCGVPLTSVIYNTNTRSADYAGLKECPRPGHADYTAQLKYGESHDIAGGGHFSGRLTAPLCIAGGMCIQWLNNIGINITGHISAIGGIEDIPSRLDPANPQCTFADSLFPVTNGVQAEKMLAKIAEARQNGDSVGGIIECVVTGLPAGIGGPLFEGLEGRLAQVLFGIPAVKAVEFGNGFDSASMLGSQNNDSFILQDGKVQTSSNNAGGILGGITNGMPLTLRVGIKPTPSIAKPQNTVNLKTMLNTEIAIKGRHDPCIVPRAVPVVEAAVATVLMDAILAEAQGDKL